MSVSWSEVDIQTGNVPYNLKDIVDPPIPERSDVQVNLDEIFTDKYPGIVLKDVFHGKHPDLDWGVVFANKHPDISHVPNSQIIHEYDLPEDEHQDFGFQIGYRDGLPYAFYRSNCGKFIILTTHCCSDPLDPHDAL